MTWLLTGGAGYIGGHVARRLRQSGHAVVILDDFSTGFPSRLEPYRDRINVVEGSVLDERALDQAFADAATIFHQAAIPSVARSVTDPRATNEANVAGTVEVMLAAARHGARRVVYAGSSSVYGPNPELPCRETALPAPASPYATSKLAGEHYVHSLGMLHGVETVVLRYFNVFGPGQDPASHYAAVIPRFIVAALGGERPTINGSGDISRDFTYVDNVVRANILAASPSAPSGLTCNVACGARHTLLELLEAIGDAVGSAIEPRIGPVRVGDVPHSHADISLARQALGYDVVVPFDQGIAWTVAWYRQHQGSGAPSADGQPPST